MSISDDSHEAFRRATSSIFALLTLEQTRQLAQIQADPANTDRLIELAEKANEGQLSDAERAAYEGYVEANNLLAVLQAEARFRLSREP